MRKLVLHFVGDTHVELFETLFSHPLVGEERRCIRGKRSGAFKGYATFQWTKAVQALSLLMLEATVSGNTATPGSYPLLVGSSGSLASSLDYAIDKQTTWLMDMFGWDSKGSGLSRRLLVRTNPGQRMPGPVAISLNLNYLSFSEIGVMLNYQPITSNEDILALKQNLLKSINAPPVIDSNSWPTSAAA